MGLSERFWTVLANLENCKGTGKDCDPIWDKWKGKERFPFLAGRIGKDRIPEKMDRLTCMTKSVLKAVHYKQSLSK